MRTKSCGKADFDVRRSYACRQILEIYRSAGHVRRYYGPERQVAAADARSRVAGNAGAGTNADRPAPAQPAEARWL